MITITLNKIRDKSPCRGGWANVLAAHKHLGMDTEFPLVSVLNSNGLDDTLWCFNCLPEYSQLWCKYTVWCVRQVAHLLTDERSINALNVAWRHSEGMTTDGELAAAGADAWAAMDAQQRKLLQILTAGQWVDDEQGGSHALTLDFDIQAAAPEVE